MAVEDRAQTARIDGLLDKLRAAESEMRRSYARMIEVVAELENEKAGAVTGFGTTARLLAGVLQLSRGEARTRVEHAAHLVERRSLTGTVLPPRLPATAAALAEGAIGTAQVRIITATMARVPSATPPDDLALAEQTLADAARRFDPAALARIAERLLAHLDPDGTAPTDEPERSRELYVRTSRDGTVNLTGRLDPDGGARVLAVLDALNTRHPDTDGQPDQRSQPRRNADALIDAMNRVLDDGDLPATGGQRPHLTITIGLRELTEGLGTALLDTGGKITAAHARRLACDTRLIPMVLGTDSVPLDVGRAHRLASPALRAALAHRDHGCAFPGCPRRPPHCQAHHIRHWLDGGTTALENMCLLCDYHHTTVHRQNWRIRINTRGHPEFTPPHILDPTHTPLPDPLRQWAG
ncbi:MAG TPA: DUF222 domain-containing protein [Pseudonocardiaceae bacterium]